MMSSLGVQTNCGGFSLTLVALLERVLHAPSRRPSDRLTMMPAVHVDPRRGDRIAVHDDVLILDHVDSRNNLRIPSSARQWVVACLPSSGQEQSSRRDKAQVGDLTSPHGDPGDEPVAWHWLSP
jgi:hypothetical protein